MRAFIVVKAGDREIFKSRHKAVEKAKKLANLNRSETYLVAEIMTAIKPIVTVHFEEVEMDDLNDRAGNRR